MLAEIGQHQVVAYRRHGQQARLSKFSFHVVFRGKAVAAVRREAGVGRFPGRFRGQILCQVGLRAAFFLAIEFRRRLEAHQIRRFDIGVGFGDRKLNALIRTDGSAEDDSFTRVLGGAFDEPAAVADRFGGDEDTLGIPAVDDVAKTHPFCADQDSQPALQHYRKKARSYDD